MRLISATLLAFLSLGALVGPVAANDPTEGAVRMYAPGTNLTYRFALSTYPTWMQTAVHTALGPDWTSTAYNNSWLPTFTYSAAGNGQVVYSPASVSPCNTGHTNWIQCSSSWGSIYFKIFIRNFSAAPLNSGTWCNYSGGGLCWDAERALMHETEHVTMSVGNHSIQGEANTVMGAGTPNYPNFGWNTHHLQRCDQAAGQLLEGMADPTGPLADCFENVPGHGSVGLLPALTVTNPSILTCVGTLATFSGRLTVAPDSRYRALAGATLAGRTIWFDMRMAGETSWRPNFMSAVTTYFGTWSRSLSTGTVATLEFRPHVAAEPGLDGVTAPIIKASWRSVC